MHIAVEGCAHGELDIIYDAIRLLEEVNQIKVDLLLCCGDFQAVRNESDLKCMAVPIKYMAMQDFHQYYSGEKVAPVLTIFIGGNHEASNYLQELPFGGWVAPNIYYMGYAGIINIGGLRIGGLSGIYKGPDYLKGRYEKTPYTRDTIRSVYHVRNMDVFKLKQIQKPIDIFMSHDWPRGIHNHGNVKQLLHLKSHFARDIQKNCLGSRAAEDLLKKLKPRYWFSGHLHVKFPAVVRHESPSDGSSHITKFLALDKCLPRREFLQVIVFPEIVVTEPLTVSHDAEWLTVLRLTSHLLSTSNRPIYMPGKGGNERYNFTPSDAETEGTLSMMDHNLSISPCQFERTAPPYQKLASLNMSLVEMPSPYLNPQTTTLGRKLSLTDPIQHLLGKKFKAVELSSSPPTPARPSLNASEVDVTLESSSLSFVVDEADRSSTDDSYDGVETEYSGSTSPQKDIGSPAYLSPLSSSSQKSASKAKFKKFSDYSSQGQSDEDDQDRSLSMDSFILDKKDGGSEEIQLFPLVSSTPRTVAQPVKRQSLSLSQPKIVTDSSESDGFGEIALSNEGSGQSTQNSGDDKLSPGKRHSEDDLSEEAAGTQIKEPEGGTKKRRNMALYASGEDDD